MSVTPLRTRPGPPRTAFVLGGGGNLGAIQVGMLEALLERDIRPDVLVGASVGAVNAVPIAVDPTLGGLETLRRTWLDPATAQVFSSGRFNGPWQLFRKGQSMASNAKLRSMLEATLCGRRFEQLA